MIKFNRTHIRAIFISAMAMVFAASALFISSPSASMQTIPNTIVFDRYDDELNQMKIFVADADGSNVTELGPGFGPSWSPDGTKIVFTHGGAETFDLWTMDADGSNRVQITENYRSHSPAWSPTGNRIAFVSQHEGSWHIYMVDADGGNQVRLNISDTAVLDEAAPLWNHDGTKVIFQGTRSTPGGARDDYYQADASNSGATQRLTYVNALFDSAKGTVSPDGSKLAVRYQHSLQAFSLDGSQNVTNLTVGMAEPPYDPDFIPGGSRILFVKGDYIATMKADGTDVVSLDVVGGRPDWNPTQVVAEPTPTPTATPQVTIDLNLQATAAPATVAVGGQTVYTVIVNNPSLNAAANVQVSAPIASSLGIGNINASQGSCSIVNAALECVIGTIAPSSSVTLTIQAAVNAAGFIGTTFTATATETDPDANNNSQVAAVTGISSGPCAPALVEDIELRGNEQWYRDEQTGIDTLRLTIRNLSGRTLDPRVMFVIKIQTPGVTVEPSAVAGYTQCTTPNGMPYLVAYAPNKKDWKPMQNITVRIPFVNPTGGPIDWTPALYTGTLNP